MIKFHKIANAPKAGKPGEEHIWFADYGAIYVSDKNGAPKLITAGTVRGKNIPTGKPKEPNILYYCESNKKHYISGMDKWVEIPSKSIPGTGGAPGTAGTIIIEDLADWYTSVDVEDALAEIGATFPHLLGKKVLTDYGDNVSKLNYPSEVHLTPTATSTPVKGLHGWQTTRKASDKNVYGSLVANNGDIYSVVNQKYRRMALADDLKTVKDFATNGIKNIGDAKISVGTGLKTNGKTLSQGIKIEFDDKTFPYKNFVKKDGDTMSAPLDVKSKSGDSIVSVVGGQNNHRVGLYYNPATDNTGIFDYTSGNGIIRHNTKTGRTSLYSYTKDKKDSASGRLDMYADSQIKMSVAASPHNLTDSGVSIDANNTNRGLRIQNRKGGLTFGSSGNINFIDSTTTNIEGTRNLRIGGSTGGRMDLFEVNASRAQFTGDVNMNGGINIGYDENTNRGTSASTSKLYLYPFETANNRGKDFYTHIGYSQSSQVLYIRSYDKKGVTTSTTPGKIKIGSQVVITRPVDISGTHLAVGGQYTVMEIIGNRVVVGRGGVVTAAMHISNLKLVGGGTSTTTTGVKQVPLTVKATKFVNTSSIEYKNVQSAFKEDALSKVKSTDVFKYRFKNAMDNSTSIGLIIEKGAPKEIVEGDAIDNYAMTSYLWRAVQQLSEELDELKASKA